MRSSKALHSGDLAVAPAPAFAFASAPALAPLASALTFDRALAFALALAPVRESKIGFIWQGQFNKDDFQDVVVVVVGGGGGGGGGDLSVLHRPDMDLEFGV